MGKRIRDQVARICFAAVVAFVVMSFLAAPKISAVTKNVYVYMQKNGYDIKVQSYYRVKWNTDYKYIYVSNADYGYKAPIPNLPANQELVGWTTSPYIGTIPANSLGSYPIDATKLSDRTVYLYPVVRTKQFSVWFKDGSSTLRSTMVNYGNTVGIPSPPQKTGYIFKGWYADYSCTSPYQFNTSIYSNVSIYAKFISTTISFSQGSSKTIYKDASINLTPQGNQLYSSVGWKWDPSYLDGQFSKGATFKAKKEGTTKVTYTNSEGQVASITIKITLTAAQKEALQKEKDKNKTQGTTKIDEDVPFTPPEGSVFKNEFPGAEGTISFIDQNGYGGTIPYVAGGGIGPESNGKMLVLVFGAIGILLTATGGGILFAVKKKKKREKGTTQVAKSKPKAKSLNVFNQEIKNTNKVRKKKEKEVKVPLPFKPAELEPTLDQLDQELEAFVAAVAVPRTKKSKYDTVQDIEKIDDFVLRPIGEQQAVAARVEENLPIENSQIFEQPIKDFLINETISQTNSIQQPFHNLNENEVDDDQEHILAFDDSFLHEDSLENRESNGDFEMFSPNVQFQNIKSNYEETIPTAIPITGSMLQSAQYKRRNIVKAKSLKS